MELPAQCPCCAEWISLVIDEGGGTQQQYTEDCPVCCRPLEVQVAESEPGAFDLTLRRSDD